MREITIATRGSALALWQANYIKKRLEDVSQDVRITLMVIKTKGDRILDVPLANVGGKGLFVKEIEEALLSGVADIAVHSMKDVPMELPEELFLGAIIEREDPTDMLLSVEYSNLESLPKGACIGTSSLRRQAQLLALRPDLQLVSLRGNIDTRLRKLMERSFDAVVMASSGITRLGLSAPYMSSISPSVVLPAVGQGALGIELRKERHDLVNLLSFLDHRPTRICVEAERSFLSGLEGGCQVPIAGYATLSDKEIITLEGIVAEIDGSLLIHKKIEGQAKDAYDIGVELSKILISEGAGDILARVYNNTSYV